MSSLAPLACPGCGASVALTDDDVVDCGHCGDAVAIPGEHRQLRERAWKARSKRQAAEMLLRSLLDGAYPRWVAKLYGRLVMPAFVLGVPLALGLTQSEYHWFAREWVVLAGLAPFLVTLLPWLAIDARTSPWVYFETLGHRLKSAPPREGGGFDCGACGGPLEIEAEAFAATCDYCLTDSWLRGVSAQHDPAAASSTHESNLAALVSAEKFANSDLKLLYAVYIPVVAIALALFWFFLPGRAVLVAEAMHVEGPWQPLGELTNVQDLALTDTGHVVVVRAGGQVLDWHEGAWRRLGEGYAGVAAAGEQVLVVGPGGRVAWLDEGRLEVEDTGDARDLVDAFVFGTGEAIAVGDEGAIVRFDGERWLVDETGGAVPYAAAWGRSPTDLHVVGMVGLVRHLEGTTWTESFVEELPSLVAVTGTSQGEVYVAANSPAAEIQGAVWRITGDSHALHDVSQLGFTSLSAAGDEVLATELDGTVDSSGGSLPVYFPTAPSMAPIFAGAVAPAALSFDAPGGVLLVEGRHVVAGDDGVFVSRQDL